MILSRVKGFAAFWYDFVIGDDWRVALGVVLALVVTYLLAQRGYPGVWWVVPAAVVLLLPASLWRATRRAG